MNWNRKELREKIKEDIDNDKDIFALKELERFYTHIDINHHGNPNLCNPECIGNFDMDVFKDYLTRIEDKLNKFLIH